MACEKIVLEGKSRAEVVKAGTKLFRSKMMGALLGEQLGGEDGSLNWSCSLANITRGYFEICTWTHMEQKYPGKALVIVGERSKHVVGLPRKTPAASLESYYSDCFSRVDLSVVPEAGHWVYKGREISISQAIARYLHSPIM